MSQILAYIFIHSLVHNGFVIDPRPGQDDQLRRERRRVPMHGNEAFFDLCVDRVSTFQRHQETERLEMDWRQDLTGFSYLEILPAVTARWEFDGCLAKASPYDVGVTQSQEVHRPRFAVH
eukprot:m.75763 g.75763  ORF g.75763 m.75763 type:complete len:120 (+) comp10444_c0_seq1:67-426(+)